MQSGHNPYQPQGGQPQSGGFGQQPQQPQQPAYPQPGQMPQQHSSSYGQAPQGGAVPDFAAPQYGAAPGSGFSFNATDREKMAKAGKGAKAMGIFLLISAGLSLISTNIVAAATNGLIGMFFLQGGTPLARLEEQPNGDDISNVMEGFENLSNMFLTRIILLCIGLGIMLLVFVGMLAVIGSVGFEEFLREIT